MILSLKDTLHPLKKYLTLILVGLFLNLGGCLAKYKDISDDPRYSHLVGKEYQLRSDMILHGVDSPRTPGKKIDLYTLSPKPGFVGREVLRRDIVKKGTIITILKVMYCTNCLVSKKDRVELVIDMDFNKNLAPTYNFIDIGGADIVQYSQDGKASLNHSLFKLKGISINCPNML